MGQQDLGDLELLHHRLGHLHLGYHFYHLDLCYLVDRLDLDDLV